MTSDAVPGSQAIPLIALVGRPNVGKSSLFNRLTRSRAALVDNTPGLTRDRQYGLANFRLPAHPSCNAPEHSDHSFTNGEISQKQVSGYTVRLVDTGGFESETIESVTIAMREQTLVAVEEADVILFVTDGQAGLLADDWEIVNLLRRSHKPLICVVNKAEGGRGQDGILEFHRLGIHPLLAVSATHGMGMELLVKQVVKLLHDVALGETLQVSSKDGEPAIHVAVVGCPNAGKSTLINQMLGEERLVVADMPGTTRDSIDLPLTDQKGRAFVLVDTAGIRKKSRISLRIEKYAVLAAMRAMDRAKVAVLLLDAVRGITDQDRRVANLAMESGCGLILAVNKWDAFNQRAAQQRAQQGRVQRRERGGGHHDPRKLFLEEVRDSFPQFTHAPVLFLAAKTGMGVDQVLPSVVTVWQAGNQRIPTGALNRWLEEVTTRHSPPRSGGQAVKIRYVTQTSVNPPTLIFFTNRDVAIHPTYRRYLENQLRNQFEFSGAALRIFFRAGSQDNPYAPSKTAKAKTARTKTSRTKASKAKTSRTKKGPAKVKGRDRRRCAGVCSG